MDINVLIDEVGDVIRKMPELSLSGQKEEVKKVQLYCQKFREFMRSNDITSTYIDGKIRDLEYAAVELAKRRTKNSRPDSFYVHEAFMAIDRLRVNLKSPKAVES